MATFKISGQLYKVEAPQTNDRGYTSQQLVILQRNPQDPRFDDYIAVELFGDKVALSNALQPGMIVEASVAIRGRKYARKDTGAEAFFTSLSCFEIAPLNAHAPQQPAYSNPVIPGAHPQQAGYPPMPPATPQAAPQPQQGDLPF